MRRPSSIPKSAKRIGQGHFSTAYRDGNKVYLHSNDPMKECMSLGWFPKHRSFPNVDLIDVEPHDGRNVYLMEYYEPLVGNVNKLKENERRFLKDLQGLTNNWFKENGKELYERVGSGIKKYISSRAKRNLLLDALNATLNYGSDIGFEADLRNLRYKSGRIILIDCFLVQSSLNKR